MPPPTLLHHQLPQPHPTASIGENTRTKAANHPTNKLVISIDNDKETIGYRTYDFAGLHKVPKFQDYLPLPYFTNDFSVYK